MNDPSKNGGSEPPKKISKNIEINLDGDGNFEQALETGMGAIKVVMEGLVNMAQEMVGPEMMKNLEAASWLSQVAESVAGINDQNLVEKSGELACFLERVEAELEGSKLGAQQSAILDRLREAAQIVDKSIGSTLSDEQSKNLAKTAGYFRAAAASVVPPTQGEP